MTISYEKLWKLMKQNKMRKKDLVVAAELTQYVMTRLGRNETVCMDVMIRLCKVFHCDIGDLMKVIKEE